MDGETRDRLQRVLQRHFDQAWLHELAQTNSAVFRVTDLSGKHLVVIGLSARRRTAIGRDLMVELKSGGGFACVKDKEVYWFEPTPTQLQRILEGQPDKDGKSHHVETQILPASITVRCKGRNQSVTLNGGILISNEEE